MKCSRYFYCILSHCFLILSSGYRQAGYTRRAARPSSFRLFNTSTETLVRDDTAPAEGGTRSNRAEGGGYLNTWLLRCSCGHSFDVRRKCWTRSRLAISTCRASQLLILACSDVGAQFFIGSCINRLILQQIDRRSVGSMSKGLVECGACLMLLGRNSSKYKKYVPEGSRMMGEHQARSPAQNDRECPFCYRF